MAVKGEKYNRLLLMMLLVTGKILDTLCRDLTQVHSNGKLLSPFACIVKVYSFTFLSSVLFTCVHMYIEC